MRGGFTYIVTNKPFGVLYTGVTADIAARACSLIANAGVRNLQPGGIARA